MPSSSRLRGSCAPQRAVTGTPMSERQQMALVMQMTSQANATNPVISNASHGTPRSRDRNERGETPLHIAAIKGDHEKVKKILDQGTDPNVTDFAGWTPLHEACSNGRLKVAIMLIEAGANVNAHGFENDTPLHDAASNGQISLVKYLLESGANPHLKNSRGKMPFDVAKPPADEILADITKDNAPSQRASHGNRSRDDSKKTNSGSDETSTSAACSTSNMETLNKNAEDKSDTKETTTASTTEKSVVSTSSSVSKTEGESNASSVSTTTATPEESTPANASSKRSFAEAETTDGDNAEDEATKRKKRKETEPVKEVSKTVQQNRANVGRSGLISGTKPPGPASKTGVAPLSKGGGPLSSAGNKTNTNCANQKSASAHSSSNQNKTSGSGGSTPGKSNAVQSSQSGKSGAGNQSKGQNSNLSVAQVNVKGAPDKKSPCASPKAFVQKSEDGDGEDTKIDSGGLKVPPLKIVIPGGVGGAGSSSNQQEGDGGSAQRGNAKNRSNTSTLPYIIHLGDNADGNDDEKRSSGSDDKSSASAQRVLRSHRNNDGEREKDRGRSSPHVSTPCSPSGAPVPTKTPPPYHSRQSPDNVIFDASAIPSTSGTSSNSSSGSGGNSSSQGTPVVDLHPRKRKIKASRDSHQSLSSSSSHQSSNEGNSGESSNTYNPHANPYQQYLNIRKQVERKQKGLFPVQPKPPQGFKDYLINRCSYVLKSNNKQQPIVNPPPTVPLQMRETFVSQENERHALRVQHLVEKEKLVLAVELEILRVHGRAARALANQSLPFSVCTLLMDHEVYNIQTPEQEEKERNAQRSRYNGRLFLSWLQDVDDKWEKIKEAMVRRHHTEAESLHSTQSLSWEWKLKEFGICDRKITPSIEISHVPMVHVSDDFDLLPA